MKILVPIQGIIFFRNFITSGALSDLAKHHDVLVSAANPALKEFPLPDRLRWALEFPVDKRRNKIRSFVQEFVMCGLRKRCHTFQLKIYRLSRKKQWIYPLIATHRTARWVQSLSEWVLGINHAVDRWLKAIGPDWVLIPSSSEDGLSADIIKSAHLQGIHHMLLINGWDNLTSKGTLPVHPQWLAVWGEQAKGDAIRIHDVKASQIKMLGAPHFELYFRSTPHADDIEQIRRLHHVPEGARLLLFGGCLQPFDEMAVLESLNHAISRGELGRLHVIFRPHPWRHARQHEAPFEAHKLQHVTLDNQVGPVFMKVQNLNRPVESHKHYPDLSFYPRLIQAADAVISPLSTFVLESLLMGKKTLALCYSDGKHYFSADKVSQYEHVKIMENAPGLLFCRSAPQLISDVQKILAMTHGAELTSAMARHLKSILNDDGRSYAARLAEVIENSSNR